jgi:hypothetical protein
MPMIRREDKPCADCRKPFSAPVYLTKKHKSEYSPKRCSPCHYKYRHRATGGFKVRGPRKKSATRAATPTAPRPTNALKHANPKGGGYPPMGYLDTSAGKDSPPQYVPGDSPLGLLKTMRDALAALERWVDQAHAREQAAADEAADKIAEQCATITNLERKFNAIKAAVA